MADYSKMRLGRKAIKTDSRTLALGDYLTPGLPPPPPTADWTKEIGGIVELRFKAGEQLFPDGIAAGTNAGSDGCNQVFRARAEFEPHRANTSFDDAL